jgi:hypothetical protein
MKTEKEKIEQWDFVDNAIFDLIQTLNPSENELIWDIKLISEIRDVLVNIFVNELKLCNEEDFYP